MYNLIVSADEESWDGEPFVIERDRFMEYTDDEIKEKYQKLSDHDLKEIIQFPCVFAYEKYCNKDPKFGLIREVIVRRKEIKLIYEIIKIESFLTSEILNDLKFDLDIGNLELNRTHWAIKDINLPKELNRINITLPNWIRNEKRAIDITKHIFQVALSFPGEIRDYVESLTTELESIIGPDSYFYDNNYKAQLARPSLDILLQNIYSNQAKLIVVFLCAKYQEKKWCGLEFKSIREIIFNKQNEKIMYVKMDDGKVEGFFQTDGYIDGRTHNPKELAGFIKARIDLIVAE